MLFAEQYKHALLDAISAIDLNKVQAATDLLAEARKQGRRIFVCGNGGSAASSTHFVTDMVKGASYGQEERFRIIALTESVPTITAYSNDVGYDCVFVEQLKNFAQAGDVVIGVSGS